MATANDEYQRLLIRHATDVEGFEEELVATLVGILSSTEQDLVDRIRKLLDRLPAGATPAGLRRLEAMLAGLREIRQQAWAEYNRRLRQELFDFAKAEIGFNQEAFRSAVSLRDVELAAPTVATLRAALFERPFRLNANDARTLAEYMAGLRVQDFERIENAIRIGYIEGLTTDQIVQSIRGTKALRYRDGILAISKRHATTIARTGLSHFANAARETLWENNDEVILGLIWVSVLDGRTTLICQVRDGRVAPFPGQTLPRAVQLPLLDPPTARPPAHANCRSIMVALISPEGLIGTRPFVVDLRTGERTAFTSAAQRRRWAEARIGRVPATINYEQFILNEDPAFQKRVYGPTRAKLLREGGLRLEDLVNRRGRRYTLDELLRLNRQAFERAGLV